MSLVGSLEDLSLGDILQIISLSQKSGVLALETQGCGGRIVFARGLVRGAVVKDGPRDLRGVLVDGGFLSAGEYEAAEQAAETDGGDLASIVVASTDLTSERIDSLCREAVEVAVCTMFSWHVGDFSFDVRTEPEPDDPQLLLPTGINAQFLAMEAVRMRDEGGRGAAVSDASAPAPGDADAAFDQMPAEEMFGVVDNASVSASAGPEPIEQAGGLPAWGEASGSPVPEAVDTLAQATLEHVETLEAAETEAEFESPMDGAPLLEELEAVFDAAESVLEAQAEPNPADVIEPLEAPLLEAHELEHVDDEVADSPEWLTEPIDDDTVPDIAVATPLEEAELAADFVATPLDAVEGPALIREAETLPEYAADEVEPLEAPLIDAVPESVEPMVAQPAAAHDVPPDEPSNVPMVVVDPDLVALEWIKYSLKESFEHVHIFQGSEQGLARIRQYLVRGRPPLVMIAPSVQVDTLSGIRDTADFVARLKSQSPKIRTLWLQEVGAAAVHGAPADGAVTRPPHRQLTLGGTTPERLEELAGVFAASVRAEVARIGTTGEESVQRRERRSGGIPRDVLERLRDATRALTEASSRGEVLPLVIRFAAETFSRVAMFMVLDGVAAGMAQHGLDRCGGPDDDALRGVHVQTDSSAWMRSVLESRKSVQGSPDDAGDRELVSMLGNRVPQSAYLAPIESAGQVIALLYGDNLPDESPIGDTSSLEVVMHHAGLALDRAALERALVEGESEA